MVSRGKGRQVLFRQCKQTNRRPEPPAMFRVSGMLEVFLQMNKGASRLDQSLEEIVVRGVVIEPNLFQDVVRFVIAPLVPATKIGAIERVVFDLAANIGIIFLELAHES